LLDKDKIIKEKDDQIQLLQIDKDKFQKETEDIQETLLKIDIKLKQNEDNIDTYK
jgi:hypothetical protein